jgi:AsmA protein
VKFLFSKRGLAVVAALVLVLFLYRPGVYKLRTRISTSIGSALGRKVSLDNVSLHLLPRPGFDLEGLVVYDDPAFSAEPMVRAQEVSAAIRFRSLLRGRLEIAALSATEPSINLVRNHEGHWNLATLIERNAQIPAAPTGKSPSERRPAFPYLEASGARINFKLGDTKKSFALMDADVALWQDSENSWGARIKAEPVRTDFNLTDTGLVQINAAWQRASSLRLTPVRIAMQWKNGQLGQITQLLSGNDRGWRGGLNFTAKLSGTPEALRIESQAVVDDFRRYDIVGAESVLLRAACSAEYNAVASALAELLCESPVGNGGTVRLRGSLALFAPALAYDLTFNVDKVPLASALRLLRQAKKRLPADLTAAGLLNAEFRATRGVHALSNISENARRVSLPRSLQFPLQTPLEKWTGSGAATNVRFSTNSGKYEVSFGTIPLTLVGLDASERKLAHSKTTLEKEPEPAEPHLRIGPAALTLTANASAPVNAGGWISARGYRFFLRGDLELKNLFRLEDTLGLPVARPAADGAAQVDVSISGPWQGFAPPTTLGTAQLRDVRAEMRGLNAPIEIASAVLSLTPDAVSMRNISARIASAHWSGEVSAPRHCPAPNAVPSSVPAAAPNCVFQFDLTADQLSTGDLAAWLAPHPAKRPWYRILNSDSNDNAAQGPSPLLALQAHGNLHLGRFDLKKLSATQLAAAVGVDRGKIALTALRAQLLEGTHLGNWTIDVSTQPVRYHGAGALRNISLAQVASLLSNTFGNTMNDAWIVGTADGTFDLDASGDSFRELLAHSNAKLQFAMRNGSLPHIQIPGSPAPLSVHRFAGELHLEKGVWKLPPARLESRDGIYLVGGTASPSAALNFVLTRGDKQSWALTGTLANPQIAPKADAKSAKR